MSQVEIPLVPVVDNTNGWAAPAADHAIRNRSIYLRFEQVSEEYGKVTYTVTALGDEMQKHLHVGGGQPQGTLTLKRDILETAIIEIQQAWQEHVVQRSESKPGSNQEQWHPFNSDWNLSADPYADARLQEVARPLAAAGYRLFQLLFRLGDEDAKDIGGELEKILSDPGQVITIQSDSLFAPWWLLYTPPQGFESFEEDVSLPVPWEGFWGYSHLVEHNFKYSRKWKPCIRIGNTGITAGVNVDRCLDETFPEAPSVTPVIEMFEALADSTITRETKLALGSAIKSSDYCDNIVYFGCHGIGVSAASGPAQAQVRLTDRQAIRSTDFVTWLAQSPLHTNPVIFINACEAGQISLFYTSIGSVLMENGANCLLGPQIEIPPSFAAAYASAFFRAAIQPEVALPGNPAPVRVGDVFQRLARTWVTQYKNPLGLAMSLYRGLDSHFCRA